MSLFAGSLTTGKLLNGGLFNGGLFYNANREIFYAPLTTTLVPSTGNFSPAFARSTTASVTDFEGIIRKANSGEARFEGARRVENLVSYSQNFGGASWGLGGGGVTVSGDQLTFPTGTDFWYQSILSKVSVGRTYLIRVDLKSGTKNFIKIGLPDSIDTYFSVNLTPTYQTFYFSFTITTLGSPFRVGFENRTNFGGDGTIGTIFAKNFQVEDVTGQVNQNPSEYVSTNVLTSAPYHGANVDGVKYFAYQNGNTVSSGVVTEAQGAAIPDATLKGYLAEGQRTNLALYSNDFSHATWVKSNLTQSASTLTATATNGTLLQTVTSPSQTHTFSIQIKRKTGTGAIALTLDNGAMWTTKTITSAWTKYEITQTLANPIFGIRVSTSGDQIDVRHGQIEAATFASSPILTTSSSVTRNSDLLTYSFGLPKDGSAYAEATSITDAITFGRIIDKGDARNVLSISHQNRLEAYDGNAPVGNAFGIYFNDGIKKVASRWSEITLTIKLFNDGALSTEYAYNGSFDGNSTTSFGMYSSGGIDNSLFGTMRNVKIYNSVLTDSELV